MVQIIIYSCDCEYICLHIWGREGSMIHMTFLLHYLLRFVATLLLKLPKEIIVKETMHMIGIVIALQ